MSPQAAGLIRAWNKGRAAALAGVAKASCPYAELNNRDAWGQGWEDGRAERVREGQAF